MNQQKILAIVQPQAWVNDYAVDIDGAFEVDVTDRVLDLNLAELHALEDNRDSTDNLIDVRAIDFDGPFTVRAVDRIAAFFGVDELAQVTQEQLNAARLS